ncbi:major facilitator superfamily [Schizophyllum amplum]|uniref:Major facilitator superfamily n=1 Tax=Schizophyllum amplum TaxID=97359 RepID=A0A550C6L1_9AGAR|nr:major facilitator superfamily [Auriculariopsis ampla]
MGSLQAAAPDHDAEAGSPLKIVCPGDSRSLDTPAHPILTVQTNLSLPLAKRLLIFTSLALVMVVSTMDSVIVATGLPTISAALGAGTAITWVPGGYLLMSTACMPLYGRLSDIFGRQVMLCLALALFAVGNLLSGFAATTIQLVVFRAVAGAGDGGLVSLAQIVISDVVSLRERGKYQGIVGGFIALGFALGPIIGGSVAQHAGWQWCFWITIPIAVVVMGVRVEGNLKSKLLKVDYPGCAMTLGGCVLIILPITWGGVSFPWDSPVVLAPLASGIVVLVVLCLWEWRAASLPIIPMQIFKIKTVSGVFSAMFINGFVFFSSVFYLPQFYQTAHRYSPLQAGLMLIPLLVSQMAASWVAGMAVSKTGRYRGIIYTGFGLYAIGNGLLSTLTPSASKAPAIVYMIIAGCGTGMTLQTTTVAAQASVSREDVSVVTAFRNFVRLLGGTFSVTIGSVIM